MTRCMLMLALAMLMAAQAQAQFGNLKGLMKNAKEKVKTTVKEKANDKTGNVKDRAASIGSYATDEEAVSGETVTDLSGNETDGRAEQDMQTLFPYDRKQFATAGIFLDGTEKTENFIYYLYAKICEMLTGSEGMPHGAVVCACCPVCPDNRVLAYGEPVVNAFFYDYMQKPDDYKNFRQMIKGYVVAQSYYFGFLKQQMADGSNTQIVDSENKTHTLWEKENDRLFRGYMLMKAAEELSARSDYSNVFDATYSCLTQADKAYGNDKKQAAYNNYREFRIAYENFLTKHPQWRQDSRATDFAAMYNKALERQREIRDAVLDDLKEPQDMPKTYGAIAGIEGKIRECIGIEDPAHKSAPIVFLSSGWRPLYKSGTKVIDQRAVDVGWKYTDAKGQKWLAYGTFMQKAVYEGLVVKYINRFMFSGGYKTMKLK